MYQHIRDQGVPDDHIILLVYDDIPTDTRNKKPGEVYHTPSVEEVRKEAFPDFTGEQVNKRMFLDILTGTGSQAGEPLLQSDEVANLAERLILAGKKVSIETNGTIPFDMLPEEVSICMDVKCPSSGEKSNLTLLSALKPKDSVKFVVGTDEDLTYAQSVIENYSIHAEIFISPVYGTDYQHIAAYILKQNLPARLQLQLHKFIGMP